jgi:hypothetical protein
MEKFKDLVIPELEAMVDKFLEDARVELKLPVEDFEKILEKDQTIFDTIDQTLTEFILNKQNTEYVDEWQRKLKANLSVILDEHKEMFLHYFLFVNACFCVFNKIKDDLNRKQANVSDIIPIAILGTLCRLSDEIGVLLAHGSIKAALSLWRSFFDHAVIGIFLLKENSDDLYKKFADYSHKDVKKKKDFFDKHRESLKFPAMEEERSSAIDARTQELKDQYGTDFFRDYGWAKDHLEARPTFLAIEEKADMDRYHTFYVWASDFTHPNFLAMANFGEGEDKLILDRIIAPDMEKQSFIDPMQLTLGVFIDYLNHFLWKYSVDHQYSTNMIFFNKIYKNLTNLF